MTLLLAAVLAQEDPWSDALGFLVRHSAPRACSCVPLKPGDPGRIVVAFLANGYSDLSADRIGGENVGKLLGRLLAGIAGAQRDDGLFFPDDPAANAWTAFALAETYGATGGERWKDPARRAAEAILGMPASDEDAVFLQALVLRSAFSGGLLPTRFELPPPGDDATPLGIAKTDHHFVHSRRHDRMAHVNWRRAVEKLWFARQLKEGCGAGSWGNATEETSYLMTGFGRWCWPCRIVFPEK
jgi:hypothetical protein